MPRFNKNQYSLKEVYDNYKKSVSKPLTPKEHKQVLEVWGGKVSASLLKGEDVKLHCGLSVLEIRKEYEPTYVDLRESKLQGKKVKKSNVQSNFFKAKIRWRRRYTKVNSFGWAFEPARALSRALSPIMKRPHGHTRFMERVRVTMKPKTI